MIEFHIDDEWAGARLDKFLKAKLSTVPHSHLFKMIRTKKVRVNGKRCFPEQTLQRGDLLAIRGDEKQLLSPEGKPKAAAPAVDPHALDVLFEDDWMMAVNKPSGMAVHTGSGITGGTLVDYVRAYAGNRTRNDFAPSPAHRLDRETSGVILVAKRRPAMVHFTDVFTNGKAKKRYLALVKGRMPKPRGVIDLPLSEHQQTAESKARRGVNMQEALTRWSLLGQAGEASYLEASIETGRTHQIRRHFAALAHPVAGDRKYGDFAFNREAKARWGLKRLFLHSERIEFPHPQDGRKMTVTAPLPQELVDVLQRVGLGDSGKDVSH